MISFLIFTMDQGIGGHYFSLQTISRTFAKKNVIVIGFTKPQIEFEKHTFIDLNKKSFIGALNELKSLTNHTKTIHCFDEHSYFYGRLVSILSNIPILLTKCGGKHTKYYPKGQVTVFSMEDQEKFRAKGRIVSLIPNRIDVNDIKNSQVSKMDVIESLDNKSLVKILCVARIGKKYHAKIESAFQLLSQLKKNSILVIIGSIEDVDVYSSIMNNINMRGLTNVFVLTDKIYIKKASNYIGLFDIVVGTGRSAMESICLGKQTSIPVTDLKTPVTVTPDTLQSLLYYNFSGRTHANEVSNNPTLVIMENIDLRDYYASITRKYFDVNGGVLKYKAEYKRAKSQSVWQIFDILLNGLYLMYIKRQKLK